MKRELGIAKCGLAGGGQPIWAVGSTMCERNCCFTCITGESDDSGDFSVIADKQHSFNSHIVSVYYYSFI